MLRYDNCSSDCTRYELFEELLIVHHEEFIGAWEVNRYDHGRWAFLEHCVRISTRLLKHRSGWSYDCTHLITFEAGILDA